MPMDNRWFSKPEIFHSTRNGLSNQNNYNNDISESQKDYEDPEYYYSNPPDLPRKRTPPPLPPMNSLQKIVPTHLVIEHKQRNGCNSKSMSLGCLLATVTVLFILSLAYILAWNLRKDDNFKNLSQSIILTAPDKYSTRSMYSFSDTNVVKSKVDIDVMATYLLTLLITKRKLCLFEAGTDRSEESKRQFREEHIESARLLQFANLSVNGTPVHPLQFQRYVRSLGVDADCYVIIYDRGEVVWATHALWIFALFGHQKVSLYSGGINEWKKLKINSAQYRTESGDGTYPRRNGHFRAEWNAAVISTFDDVLTNTELKTHDLVDGQNRKQYEGISSGAVYGHIRSAINVPAEDVYDWHDQKWHDELDLKAQLRSRKLNENRPVIVYSSSAIHSSLTWFTLRKCGYNSSIYFGSWPEWLIRAPEFLKIIPKKRF
ncbi:rhodanese-like protein [Onchocerca flexuosa]|uniref:Rhodanese-like protein n=2 Tax=Onchocerca flexuosa TaxID=387005 RepID=A0A238BYJ3_9BILA|nr:rhodanese-like protein [Onchocerca flexuosa]